MRIRKPHQRIGLLFLLYMWWLILSWSYLKLYLGNRIIGGADGSGHEMLVHLFATHVFPNLTGWLPEPYGGMPFPVFYPPLFYCAGAALMKFTGISASLAVKILATASFAAMPGALFLLGRRVGLKITEAFLASAWAGVIACGSNVASLSGIGLLGQFEVGLYTQTLGFVWLCIWCGSLPYAYRSWKAATIAVFALCMTILSNVHVLPFAGIYALGWLTVTCFRTLRSTKPPWLQIVRSVLWLITPVLISGIWLVPLIKWYHYSVGRPLPTEGLFASLGGFNVVWLGCALMAWKERKRHPNLALLSVAILLAATIALTPLGEMIKSIPFQPARVLAGPMILATIPLTKLFANTLRDVVGGERWVVHLSLGFLLVSLAWVHPSQRFGIASFSDADGQGVEQIRRAVQQLAPGKLLVEIVESDAIFNSRAPNPKELALSRGIAHQIAIDGRPVLWTVFREQTLTSPFFTSASNLFSTTKERFGIGGFGVEESLQDTLSVADKIKIARHLGVRYYLVKTAPQVELLSRSLDLSKVWSIGNWHLFADKWNSESSTFVRVTGTPVLAWIPAHFKNRSGSEVDLFNLGEGLAYIGHPEIPVLWASSEGVDIARFISHSTGVTFIIDPSVRPDLLEKLLSSMEGDSSRRLNVVLLNDQSRAASLLLARRQSFASFQTLEIDQYSAVPRSLIKDIATRVVRLDSTKLATLPADWQLWQTSMAYFPAWQAQGNGEIFLTGQGSMSIWTPQLPILRWAPIKVQILSLAVCGFGILLFLVNVKLPESLRRN